ncbi:MAG: LptA/OstA family protein, partial [Myxococcaceae bacterium]
MSALLLLALLLGTPPKVLARPVQVSADRLDILGREDKAIYSGHARAVRDETTITCDRLVVSYSKRQEVDRIDAEGSVVVTDQDRRATGERATFDNATGVLTVTGDPQAFQGGRHVQGSKVVITTGTDVIDIDDAKTV